MYRKPSSFNAIVEHEKLSHICFSVTKNHLWQAEMLIKRLKPLNIKDKSFCYTCFCTEEGKRLYWKFAYSSFMLYAGAYDILHSTIKEILGCDNRKRIDNFENVEACSCPFRSD
jgi:hypothetical protein